jgi:CRP/FNR family transcriptional regulator, cyclic AMP receptor protein
MGVTMTDSGRAGHRKRDADAVTSAGSIRSPFLDAIGEAERAALVARLRPRSYAKGAVVFNDGALGDSMYLVQSGRLDVQSTTASGHVITFRVIHPGEVFGELALVHPSHRRVGRVRALEPSVVYALQRRDFDDVRALHPAVDRFLVAVLAERVVRTSALAVELLLPPEQRVWRRLAVLAEAYGYEPIVMTQDALAEAAGTVRQTANRVINAGVRLGIVKISRGVIHIIDCEALQHMADGYQ